MAISNAIQDLKDRVLSAYGACEEKGAELPDVKNTANLPDCIRSIQTGTSGNPELYEMVCKKVAFCQSKLISEGGKGSYAGAWICLRYSDGDYEDFTLGSSNVRAIRTSDGHYYSYENDGANITHQWDHTEDFAIEGVDAGSKFNWVIYYFSANSIVSNSSYLDCAKGLNIVYVFDMDLKFYSVSSGSSSNQYGLSRYNTVVQSFDFINGHSCYGNSATNFGYFCSYNYSLVKLPDALNTSQGTNFANFCRECQVLVKFPDNLDTSKGTDFTSFANSCYSLTRLPDGLDTRSGSNFSFFCSGCYSLSELPDGVVVNNGTDFQYFLSYCRSLTKIPEGINTSNGTNFNYFCYYCTSLVALPSDLDVSKGTYFGNFCQCAYQLKSLPDCLDIHNARSVTQFCASCYGLKKANIILPATNLLSLSQNTNLTVESLRYIADHAPTANATLQLGSTIKAKANKYDPTIITTLTGKGWNVT